MNSKSDNATSRLRARAEASLGKEQTTPQLSQLSNNELQELIHDLQVHQIELNLQNEELITTRKSLQEAHDCYTDLFDFAPISYFTLAPNGHILNVNLIGAQLLGHNRRSLTGKLFSRFITAQSQDRYHLLQRQALKEGRAQTGEIELLRPSQNPLPVQIELLPKLDQQGQLIENRITVTDISQHKQLEEQQRMFFSIASHELRTPITNLMLSLDLLADQSLTTPSTDLKNNSTEQSRSLIELARNNADRLHNLVLNILDLQKLDAGILEYHIHPQPLLPLIEKSLDQCQPLAKQRQIRLTTKINAQTSIVNVDSGRLIQVLSNLIGNAVRFSADETEVTIQVDNCDRQRVRVGVTDHGCGIPISFQQQLFKPFSQANPSLEDTNHRHSRGLGLTICKMIIEHFQGTIGFNSHPHVITTFYFELPLTRFQASP